MARYPYSEGVGHSHSLTQFPIELLNKQCFRLSTHAQKNGPEDAFMKYCVQVRLFPADSFCSILFAIFSCYISYQL